MYINVLEEIKSLMESKSTIVLKSDGILVIYCKKTNYLFLIEYNDGNNGSKATITLDKIAVNTSIVEEHYRKLIGKIDLDSFTNGFIDLNSKGNTLSHEEINELRLVSNLLDNLINNNNTINHTIFDLSAIKMVIRFKMAINLVCKDDIDELLTKIYEVDSEKRDKLEVIISRLNTKKFWLHKKYTSIMSEVILKLFPDDTTASCRNLMEDINAHLFIANNIVDLFIIADTLDIEVSKLTYLLSLLRDLIRDKDLSFRSITKVLDLYVPDIF